METQAQTKLVTFDTQSGDSVNPSINNDGRYIVFESDNDYDNYFFPDSTSSKTNIFLRDLVNDTINLITVGSNDIAANGDSEDADISGDGRYVVFESYANNLISNSSLEDNGNYNDIFLWNLDTKTTQRVNLAYNGFQANEDSYNPKISNNGRYVVFESYADNLVSGDTNYTKDIFIRDLVDNTIERVSLGADNSEANSSSDSANISANGHYVVFESDADNLVANDNNYKTDIFIRDLVDRTTKRVSIDDDGLEGNYGSYNPDVSIDGRYVAFESNADNLVSGDTNNDQDIFVRDLITHKTIRVSVADDAFSSQSNGDSYNPSISADGRYVYFESDASNLVSGDTNYSKDVFVRDLLEGTTKRVSLTNDPDNSEVNNSSYDSSISADGRYIAFNSYADNIVNDDDYGRDIFLRDRGTAFSDSIIESDPRFLLSDVHRFYQYEKGFHLYTSDSNEVSHIKQKRIIGELKYNYETAKYQVLADDKDLISGEKIAGVEPVYRFFNNETGAHLYTMDENEKNHILNNLANYSFEGIKYYAFESEPENLSTIPVYRMLNRGSGTHLFSTDTNEINHIKTTLPDFTMENNGDAAFHVFALDNNVVL